MIQCPKCKAHNKDAVAYCKLCNHRLSIGTEAKLYDEYGNVIAWREKSTKARIRSRVHTLLHPLLPYRAHKRLWRLLLGGCTVIGGLPAPAILLPRIMVSTPSMPIDPRNSLSVAFDITNTGIVPLCEASAAMAICRIEYKQGKILGYKTTHGDNGSGGRSPDFDNLPRVERPEWKHHSLGMDERFTINIGSLFDLGSDLTVADIAIIVRYKPWLLRFNRQKVFRYIASRDKRGNMYWESWPLGEPQPTVH